MKLFLCHHGSYLEDGFSILSSESMEKAIEMLRAKQIITGPFLVWSGKLVELEGIEVAESKFYYE